MWQCEQLLGGSEALRCILANMLTHLMPQRAMSNHETLVALYACAVDYKTACHACVVQECGCGEDATRPIACMLQDEGL